MNNADKTIAVAFGRHIAEFRKRKEMTQFDLAFKSGIHRAYIGAIERGEKNVNICTIFKLAKGLDVEPYKLLKNVTQ